MVEIYNKYEIIPEAGHSVGCRHCYYERKHVINECVKRLQRKKSKILSNAFTEKERKIYYLFVVWVPSCFEKGYKWHLQWTTVFDREHQLMTMLFLTGSHQNFETYSMFYVIFCGHITSLRSTAKWHHLHYYHQTFWFGLANLATNKIIHVLYVKEM
mgnify:CR=1 FL=1